MKPEQIRRLRKSLGFSQEKFAQLLSVSWTTVNRWEAGNSGPTGMPMRILILLQDRMRDPKFKATLYGLRGQDPMFVLYNLLGQVYSRTSAHDRVPGGKIK